MSKTEAPTSTTMRAIVQDSYGSAEVLRLGQTPNPGSPMTRCWCRSAQPAWTGEPGT